MTKDEFIAALKRRAEHMRALRPSSPSPHARERRGRPPKPVASDEVGGGVMDAFDPIEAPLEDEDDYQA